MTPREESIKMWERHPDVKHRIASIAAQIVASQISRMVKDGEISPNDDPDDPKFMAAVNRLTPDAVATARAALLAAEEFLCG